MLLIQSLLLGNKNAGLLQGSVISVYITYVTWTAVTSEPPMKGNGTYFHFLWNLWNRQPMIWGYPCIQGQVTEITVKNNFLEKLVTGCC